AEPSPAAGGRAAGESQDAGQTGQATERLPRARTTGPVLTLRLIGATGLLVMAGVHLQRLVGAGYEQLPTINTLFWLDVAAGASLAAAVLIRGHALAALAGAAVS